MKAEKEETSKNLPKCEVNGFYEKRRLKVNATKPPSLLA
jgi:hypothetical protein